MAFLVFEGLDGSGKSTLIHHLKVELERRGIPHVRTREPGGTQLGDEVRQILLRKSGEPPVARAELLLYEVARAQHVELFIRPRLREKTWVLCDRFSASSIAFQAGGRSLSEAQVKWLNDFATDGLCPDLTILLDLSIEESEKRRQQRAEETQNGMDRIESESAQFHERVRSSFLRQAREEEANWCVLDASLSQETLYRLLIEELKKRRFLL